MPTSEHAQHALRPLRHLAAATLLLTGCAAPWPAPPPVPTAAVPACLPPVDASRHARALRAYLEDLRARPGVELAAEIARQESAVAQAPTDEDAQAQLALARLLATRHAEQQRLEALVEKQSQQLREQQRRIEQLSERLEAVRAVEHSLPARPVVPAEAPPAEAAKP